MFKLLDLAVSYPFHALTGVIVIGTILMVLGISFRHLSIPMINDSYRRRIMILRSLGNPIGLIGVTTILIGFVVLYVLLSYPPDTLGDRFDKTRSAAMSATADKP